MGRRRRGEHFIIPLHPTCSPPIKTALNRGPGQGAVCITWQRQRLPITNPVSFVFVITHSLRPHCANLRKPPFGRSVGRLAGDRCDDRHFAACRPPADGRGLPHSLTPFPLFLLSGPPRCWVPCWTRSRTRTKSTRNRRETAATSARVMAIGLPARVTPTRRRRCRRRR